jgi:hypothetical protein
MHVATLRQEPLTDLRTKIERGEYSVDAGTVAGSLVSKLEVVARVRRLMASAEGSSNGVGRTHRPAERLH